MRQLVLLPALLLAVNCLAAGDSLAPQVNTLTPKTAKPGETLIITGVGLDQDKIEEVYLTDHKFDMRVKILDQKETALTLRIPPFAKAGRMQLLLLTKPVKDEDPKLLEQPVYVLIEVDTTELGQVKAPPPAPEKGKEDKP